MFTFPYETKEIDEGSLVDPRIIVNVKTRIGFLSVKFLLDSGADVTTLPLHIYAPLFHFRKKEKERITIGGVEGKGVGAYPFTITMRIDEMEFHLRSYFIESATDPLLGRLDFWDMFSVTFDNKSKMTILHPL